MFKLFEPQGSEPIEFLIDNARPGKDVPVASRKRALVIKDVRKK